MSARAWPADEWRTEDRGQVHVLSRDFPSDPGVRAPSPVHLCCVFQVSQQAMAPTRGGRAGSWKSAASRAATCGVWRCTALPPRPTSPARSATQTRREHPRPVARATKGTRARSVGQHSSRIRRKTRG